MAQSEFEQIELENGSIVVEATCPHDPTIKPRAIKKVVEKPVIAAPKEKDLIAPVAQDIRKKSKAKDE